MSGTIKTAADYLHAMYYLNIRIQNKEKRILELQALAESTGGLRYDKDRVITSTPREGGFENKAIDVTMLQQELQKDIHMFTEMYRIGEWILESLPVIDRTILDMLYVDGASIKEVAERMHYSESNIYYRKKRAMEKLQKINL